MYCTVPTGTRNARCDSLFGELAYAEGTVGYLCHRFIIGREIEIKEGNAGCPLFLLLGSPPTYPELDGSSRVAQTGLIEHHGDDKAGLGRGHGTSGHGSASLR